MTQTALVIGASRGLGLGLVREYLGRGWTVVATARDIGHGALHDLAGASGGRLRLAPLDVTDDAGIAALAETERGPLDLLFVSAGVMDDSSVPAGAVAAAEFTRVMTTNALAPMRLIEALGERVAPTGTLVAMTSVLGSVARNGSGGYEVYRASKAALNTLLRSYASRHAERAVIAMHPGWVRTDMGGSAATLGVAESAKGMADVIAERSGQAGCVFLDHAGETIAW